MESLDNKHRNSDCKQQGQRAKVADIYLMRPEEYIHQETMTSQERLNRLQGTSAKLGFVSLNQCFIPESETSADLRSLELQRAIKNEIANRKPKTQNLQ